MSVSPHTFMMVAELFSENSTCSRAHVGAVIVRDRRIISTGYNGAPAGLPHCDYEHTASECSAVHAEANAIAFSARHGVPTDAAVLYSTVAPCVVCARLIINAGIRQVYYKYTYRNEDGLEVLNEAGITTVQLDQSEL